MLLLTPAAQAGSDDDDLLTQLPERLTISPSPPAGPGHVCDGGRAVLPIEVPTQPKVTSDPSLIPGNQPIYPISSLLDRSAGSVPSGVDTLCLRLCVGADALPETSSVLATAPGLDRSLHLRFISRKTLF